MPHISRLFIYPIKSCAPVEVERLVFDRHGPVGDRRFLLVDEQGGFITQRQQPQMARIRPVLEETVLRVDVDGQATLRVPLAEQGALRKTVTVWNDSLPAEDCGDDAAAWFSSALGIDCRLVRLPADSQRQVDLRYAELGQWVSFADGFPVLVTTESSLGALSERVGRDIQMERFRPNVVVNGSAVFAERRWRMLKHKDGQLAICKPCQRCVIPTRSMDTLEREADVLDALKELCRIDGKILFGQNALVSDIHQLCVGDELTEHFVE